MADARPVYTVTITSSSSGEKRTYRCGGVQDQDALIYAGKVVEANADRHDLAAEITIEKNGIPFGPASTVRDMVTRAI